MMRFIGIVATVLAVWWVCNFIGWIIIVYSAPNGEYALVHVAYGALIMKWLNIAFVAIGIGFLAHKAYGNGSSPTLDEFK